jgi:hypothetical protein
MHFIKYVVAIFALAALSTHAKKGDGCDGVLENGYVTDCCNTA